MVGNRLRRRNRQFVGVACDGGKNDRNHACEVGADFLFPNQSCSDCVRRLLRGIRAHPAARRFPDPYQRAEEVRVFLRLSEEADAFPLQFGKAKGKAG